MKTVFVHKLMKIRFVIQIKIHVGVDHRSLPLITNAVNIISLTGAPGEMNLLISF